MKTEKFQILFVNAPSVTDSKVELPGDPVSILYAMRGLFTSLRDNNFQSNIRPSIVSHNEQSVYDPRIWNSQTLKEFKEIIQTQNPCAVFFCTYSPSHPYALEMAREIKRYNPDTLIVFGGKHQDETLSFNPSSSTYDLKSCNTLKLIHDKRIPPLVDIVVSGEGEYPIKFINEEIGKYFDLDSRFNLGRFLDYFSTRKSIIGTLGGQSIVGSIGALGNIDLSHTNYQFNSPLDFGSPYAFFPIRTKNPIFVGKNGGVKFTTNIILSRGCKNSCIYCSEGAFLNKRPVNDKVQKTLERVLQDIQLGSESAFFDDSVFFGGNFSKIQEFSSRLLGEKKAALQKQIKIKGVSLDTNFLRRLNNFEYAIQLCVEDIVGEPNKEYVLKVLRDLKESGCSYVYTSIESLDDKVMRNVQKFKQKRNELYKGWFEKVDAALGLFREAEIRVGASLLFGIPGETMETIDNTLDRIKSLLADGKLFLVSPNLCTYHPGTPLTLKDKVIDELDYITPLELDKDSLVSFEEASPGHLSKVLTPEMLNRIRCRLIELKNLNKNTIQDSLNEKK